MAKGKTEKSAPRAIVALADGTWFEGVGFGAHHGVDAPVIGEVVFNTSMYGYQEILTDPSYAGQIMCFTYPQIGNVGCNDDDEESERVFVEGCLVRELSPRESNFRSERSLDRFLLDRNVLGVSGIDTRALVRHLRDAGSQMGAMAIGGKESVAELVDRARARGSMEGKDYVRHVTCETPYSWSEPPWISPNEKAARISEEQLSARPHCVAIDCGIKRNILRLLIRSGFRVTVVPATADSATILALKPDALFLSNGPGDPATLDYVVNSVRSVLGRFPVFGICLGHQILAQVVGGKTFKLKFGHRGGNHPVLHQASGRVEITVQNHGFAVDAESLPANVTISHRNLNDQTVEGLEIPELRAFSVQYHPEASPGPHDALRYFRSFFESVVTG
jgi:carbamoyl-phosphate synthase small subunit